jgi:hypothetical protein
VRRGDGPERVVRERMRQLDHGMTRSGLGPTLILRHSDPHERVKEVESGVTVMIAPERRACERSRSRSRGTLSRWAPVALVGEIVRSTRTGCWRGSW